MAARITNPCVVILAAGRSARLGRPKQSLAFDGQTLLRRTVLAALEAGIGPVYTVLGANCDSFLKDLADLPVETVENPGWEEGIASSIRKGLKEAVVRVPATDGALFLLCDQPAVGPELLRNLTRLQSETTAPLAACAYEDTYGTPALFHRSLFGKLSALKGDTGARRLIAEHMDQAAFLDFPEGINDIDTEADYRNWLSALHLKQQP